MNYAWMMRHTSSGPKNTRILLSRLLRVVSSGVSILASAPPTVKILVDQTGISQGVTDLRQRIDKAHAINAEARQLTASVAEAFQGDTSDAFQQRRQVLLERNEQLADVTSGVVQTVSQGADEAIDADRSRATQY
ncbi:WXG100 family type VII secretion target [Mycobacterium sp.]|uniref:WXG100 family type VII secretion target n=1 Tax=Mycobacterium sp. TaxID=1785 RepID=UPI003BAB68E7